MKEIAIILTGRLKPTRQFTELIRALTTIADLYICTDKDYIDEVEKIVENDHAYFSIIDYKPSLYYQQINLGNTGLYQWLKYNECFRLINSIESKHARNYKSVIKLRSDYHYNNSEALLKLIKDSPRLLTGGYIYADSDRIFAGTRDIMYSITKFLPTAKNMFIERLNYYYPINFKQIVSSSPDAFCWQALNYDQREIYAKNEKELYSKIVQKWKESEGVINSNVIDKPPNENEIFSFHGGNKIFPAERSFAMFLNLMDINALSHIGISGHIVQMG